MMETEVLIDRMAAAYQQAFARIQIAAEAAAQDAWFATDSFAGEDEEEWNLAFWLIVSGAALAAAGLAAAYLQRQFDAEGINVIVPIPNLDWLEEDFAAWSISPMGAARGAVAQGIPPREAMQQAATQVSKLTTAVVREAEQRALAEFLEELSAPIDFDVTVTDVELDADGNLVKAKPRSKLYFKRLIQQGACGWCEVVADRLYTKKAKDSSPLGPWHNYCRCTWKKVTASEAASWEQRLKGDEWKGVINRRFTEPGENTDE